MIVNDKLKFESVKKHLTKHKSKYMVGGTLLLGFGLGLYLGSRKSDRSMGVINNPDIRLETSKAAKDSVKIIGKFREIDGEEYETFNDLRKIKKLIGSTSADVIDVELCYDNDGNTYAIARGFEEYYGKKRT